MSEPQEVQNLLRLKRYEQPSEEYFDDFLEEFHRRQREDLMKTSARSLFVERLTVWFRELGMAKWAYGAGLAYAALMVGFVLWPKGSHEPMAAPGATSLPGERTLEAVDFHKPASGDEEELERKEF
ncbi:MAG: hypothetical protein HKN82_18795 [Akkermansiaceae bacterium]|nr:hypothetical protein [Akkermansiaceae bacterium]